MSHVTDKLFIDALAAKGVKLNQDPYGGNVGLALPHTHDQLSMMLVQINGTWISAACLDRTKKWTRSYSASAYYLPHQDNPKFKVNLPTPPRRVSLN